MAEFEKKQIAG